jgi:ATP-dependent RNA circularization protein (DNA/RNA ligase family)
MKKYPSIPRVANAPDGLLEDGHLWLVEKVDGANFRFQLRDSGVLRFGDRSRVYDDVDAMPTAYAHAVRHVREQLKRDVLREAVADVEDIVFFGEAMHHHTISYDWERTPSFLGFDVWSEEEAAFRPPDAAEQIYEQLGLHPVNVFEREVNTRDFDPADYTIPTSKWRDGPAEGVIIRDKQRRRAKLLHPDYREVDDTVPLNASAEELATRYATRRRFQKLHEKLDDRNQPVTVDTLYQRILEDILREEHKQLRHSSEPVDMQAFRSAIAARTRRYLDPDQSL